MREEYYLVPRFLGSSQHPQQLLHRGDVIQHSVVVDVDDGVEQVVLLTDAHSLVNVQAVHCQVSQTRLQTLELVPEIIMRLIITSFLNCTLVAL